MLPVLREMIATRGPLSFPEFMATALYHPQWGYYADPQRKIGRHGDFFTIYEAAEVGRGFGQSHSHLGTPRVLQVKYRLVRCDATSFKTGDEARLPDPGGGMRLFGPYPRYASHRIT